MNHSLLVFSHLRWNFVFQRPQHLLSRFSRREPVYFLEEPLPGDRPEPYWELSRHEPQVTRCVPRVPLTETAGFGARETPYLQKLLAELLQAEQLSDYVAWFYTPMALPLADQLAPRAVVYDCMDELSGFRGAPPEMTAREAELFERADVVFTGGPSLYQAKRKRHPHVCCFPSSVDLAHFGQAARPLDEPADQQTLPRPRLGFFGVIDERLDAGLLDHVARARPEWQIVMVGPVVKIDPAALPRRPNIHYLGQREYVDLPAYLSGWDACLLPFARNPSTEFISPTKTLEYMAAEKPIVATPITDVAQPYGEIVYLGDTADEFLAACEQALSASDAERRERAARMRDVLRKTSWDKTVEAMQRELDAAIARRAAVEAPSAVVTASGGRKPPEPQPLETPPVVVIGAGPTGLSAAYHLGADGLLLEKNDQVGGLCRSLQDRGFTYDLAGHIMFSKDPYVHEMYEMLLGDNVHWQDREAWIYSQNVYTRYPFQGCLYGLPPEVVTECIVGAIEARFGPLDAEAPPEDVVSRAASRNGNGRAACSLSGGNGNGHAAKKASKSGEIADCCGDGILEAAAPLAASNGNGANGSPRRSAPQNFEEFIYRVWGRGIARHFAIPYNRKLWAVPLEEMETSWLGGRVPMPDLKEMIQNALAPSSKPMGPNARFGYPLRGGFQALMDGFLPHLEDRLLLQTDIERVSPSRKVVTTRDGREFPYEVLVSTMPLPKLIRGMGDEAPRRVRAAAERLRYVSVRCVHLGIGREKLTDKHWIYYPEDTVFHRIFVQGNASPHVNPPGGFGLTCEITYSPAKPLPCDGRELTDRCVRDCHRVGLFKPEDEVWSAVQADLPFAYVVYDHQRAENVEVVRRWLEARDILLAGRYGEWEYYNSDHAFIAGKNAAQAAQAKLGRRAASNV